MVRTVSQFFLFNIMVSQVLSDLERSKESGKEAAKATEYDME